MEALLMKGGRFVFVWQPITVGLITHPTRGKWLVDTGPDPRHWWFLPVKTPLPAVDGVILTHYHIDHVGGLKSLPPVPIFASKLDYESPWKLGRDDRMLGDDFLRRVTWFEDAGPDLFGDGSVIADPLPGHTRGQTGIRVGDVFFVADACGHIEMVTQNKDPLAPTLLSENRLLERETLAYLRSMKDVRIIPAHCPITCSGPLFS